MNIISTDMQHLRSVSEHDPFFPKTILVIITKVILQKLMITKAHYETQIGIPQSVPRV